MAWDALRVTAEWVWTAQTAADPGIPHAEDVRRASTLKFTSDSYPFEGASGRLWFGRNGDRMGSPPKVVQLSGN
jgi:hypothetical protein